MSLNVLAKTLHCDMHTPKRTGAKKFKGNTALKPDFATRQSHEIMKCQMENICLPIHLPNKSCGDGGQTRISREDEANLLLPRKDTFIKDH